MDTSNCIHSTGDGVLVSTPDELDALFLSLSKAERIVVHIHGGLVSKQRGLDGAARLTKSYAPAASPVFLVWESGVSEAIRNNLSDIFNEKIFGEIVSRVLKWAVGKITAEEDQSVSRAADGEPSAAEHLPDDIEHRIEIQRGLSGESEPYDGLEPATVTSPLSDDDRDAFQAELTADAELTREVEAIIESMDADAGDLERSHSPSHRRTTRMSADVLDDLFVGPGTGERSVEAAVLALVWRLGRILARVVSRFSANRDHGVYTTVVEEVLNELYLDAVGKLIWKLMKDDTAQSFKPSAEPRAGTELLLRLGGLVRKDGSPKVTLVGHSTGAVYINNLLAAAREARSDRSHPLPEGFRFSEVIFLAPACTFSDFANVLEESSDLFEAFRMFTMSDEYERRDQLLPPLYTRSLLYLISGVLESSESGSRAPDTPIVGMARYYRTDGTNDPYLAERGVRVVREFASRDGNVVWSKSAVDAGAGRRADATKHGDFDDPGQAMDSVLHILRDGWS
jgi:pimeloyl-ACP methyl ester carboxylesterase